MNEKRWTELRHQLHKLGSDYDKYRPYDTERRLATRSVRQMVEVWDDLQTNYGFSSAWDTDEERLKYVEKLIAAGAAILALAEIFLDEP